MFNHERVMFWFMKMPSSEYIQVSQLNPLQRAHIYKIGSPSKVVTREAKHLPPHTHPLSLLFRCPRWELHRRMQNEHLVNRNTELCPDTIVHKPHGSAPDVLSGGPDNWTSFSVITLINKPGGRTCVCVCMCSLERVENSRIILCQREESPVDLRELSGIFTLTKVTHYSQDINKHTATMQSTGKRAQIKRDPDQNCMIILEVD